MANASAALAARFFAYQYALERSWHDPSADLAAGTAISNDVFAYSCIPHGERFMVVVIRLLGTHRVSFYRSQMLPTLVCIALFLLCSTHFAVFVRCLGIFAVDRSCV